MQAEHAGVMHAGEAYRQQADDVLAVSAGLTEQQKLLAEFFDDKIASLARANIHATVSQNLTVVQFVHLSLITNMAPTDAAIVVWQEKARWDAVRPFSAIRALYGDEYAPLILHHGPLLMPSQI